MATLWDAAKGFRPLTLEAFVPPSFPPHVEVVHHGKNSLPAATHFQKCFCRPKAGGELLIGLNRQTLSPFTGPGYFVAHPASESGEVDIDYTVEPKERPDAWPPVVPSSSRLGVFVYHGTIDVMRGVSTHVTIGRAKRKDRFLDAWFVLVREDPRPAGGAPS